MSRKILIISSEFPPGPGGIGYHAYSLANAFVAKKYHVKVMSPADYASEKEVLQFDSNQCFDISRFPRIGWRTYINRLKLVNVELATTTYTSVILTGKFSLWIGLLMNFFGKKNKRIAILHGSEVNLSNFFLRKLTHYSIQKADHIIAVSNFTKQLLPKYILKKRMVNIVPNGININEFESIFRPDTNLNLKGTPKLLTVGHVSPRKGQHRMIKALPELIKKYPDIHYHMVGRPIYQSQFMKLAKDLNVEQYVTFHGVAKTQKDLANYYNSSDIFVILSENQPNGDVEGFGIVVLEANYFGKPAIGAKGCGIEDAISDNVNGFLVDGNSHLEISNAIDKSISKATEIETTSKAWVKKHDWNTIVSQIVELDLCV